MIKIECNNCNSSRIYPTLIYGYIGDRPLMANKTLYKCRKCGVVQHFNELGIKV